MGMEMRNLFRHNLDYDRTIGYLKEQLEGGNTLSHELLRTLNFKNGQFFTLLFAEADLHQLYEFQQGGILQQNKVQEQVDESGRKSYFSWKPSIKNELSDFILEKMSFKKCYSCVFEDVLHTPDMIQDDFFDRYGLLYESEVYYYLVDTEVSQKLILAAINQSKTLWHQLFVMSIFKSSELTNKEISLEDIKNLSKKTQLLVIRAYDGEGYVLWEPILTDE